MCQGHFGPYNLNSTQAQTESHATPYVCPYKERGLGQIAKPYSLELLVGIVLSGTDMSHKM